MNKFSTINLQAELAKNLQEILAQTEGEFEEETEEIFEEYTNIDDKEKTLKFINKGKIFSIISFRFSPKKKTDFEISYEKSGNYNIKVFFWDFSDMKAKGRNKHENIF